MAITGLPTFTDKEKLTFTKLNAFRTTIQNKFGAVTGADLKYPFLLGGNLDLNNFTLVNFGKGISEIRFADEFPSIQNAIDNLPNNGGAVFLSNKVYTVDSAIEMQGVAASSPVPKDSVTLIGCGPSTTLRASSSLPSGDPIIRMSRENATSVNHQIRNLVIDVNALAGRHGIAAKQADKGLIQGVYFTGGSATSSYIDLADAKTFKLIDLIFSSTTSGKAINIADQLFNTSLLMAQLIITGSINGISADNYQNLIISNSHFNVTAGTPISLTVRNSLASVLVEGCVIQGNSAAPNINLAITGSGQGDRTTFKGNIIALGQRGINVALNPSGNTFKTRNLVALSNIIYGSQLEGLKIAGGALSNFTIMGNDFLDNSNQGASAAYHVLLEGLDAASRIKFGSICGNTFEAGSPGTAGSVRLVPQRVQNITLVGNTGDQAASFDATDNIVDQANQFGA